MSVPGRKRKQVCVKCGRKKWVTDFPIIHQKTLERHEVCTSCYRDMVAKGYQGELDEMATKKGLLKSEPIQKLLPEELTVRQNSKIDAAENTVESNLCPPRDVVMPCCANCANRIPQRDKYNLCKAQIERPEVAMIDHNGEPKLVRTIIFPNSFVCGLWKKAE